MPDQHHTTATDLDDVSADELLEELRQRDQGVGGRRAEDLGTPTAALARTTRLALSDIDTATLAAALRTKQKVIYGPDDRVDLFEVTDAAVIQDADSVVAVFPATSFVDNGDGTSGLLTMPFGPSRNLCPGERFFEQPSGASCSGFLVAPDVVATAGHCVSALNLGSIRFVFGFRMLTALEAAATVDNDSIYQGTAVLGRQFSTRLARGSDWALVRLDRPVPDHPVVRIRRVGKIADGQAVHVIGHPSGLPTKFAGGAVVRNNATPIFFVANLDAYGGNSGSPVFNSQTHEVEGILVRGETDFVTAGTCRVSLVCPTTGCGGEDVTRTTVFTALLDGTTDVGMLLRRGSEGLEVAEWQGQLDQAGPDLIEVDGFFGPETDRVTRLFQRSHALAADGVVGPQTRTAMRAALGL